MADLSFLEAKFRERQENGPVYLADLHKDIWQEEEQQDCWRAY